MAEAIGFRRKTTIGGDKRYDTENFVEGLRDPGITPRIVATMRHGAIDGRTARDDASSRQAPRRMELSVRANGVPTRSDAAPRANAKHA